MDRKEPPQPQHPAQVANQRILVLEAEILFRNGPEVEIRHKDVTYRLRRTRGDKLILTK